MLFATRARSLEAGYVYNLHSQCSGGPRSRQPTAKSRDQGLVRVANLVFCTYVDTILIDLELEELEGQSHRAPVLSRALAKQEKVQGCPNWNRLGSLSALHASTQSGALRFKGPDLGSLGPGPTQKHSLPEEFK